MLPGSSTLARGQGATPGCDRLCSGVEQAIHAQLLWFTRPMAVNAINAINAVNGVTSVAVTSKASNSHWHARSLSVNRFQSVIQTGRASETEFCRKISN